MSVTRARLTIDGKVATTIDKRRIVDIGQMTQGLLIHSAAIAVCDDVIFVVRDPVGGRVGDGPVSIVKWCDLERL